MTDLDLDFHVGMWEAQLSSTTGEILARSIEPWFLRRLNMEVIEEAIQQLQDVKVLKEQHREQRAA